MEGKLILGFVMVMLMIGIVSASIEHTASTDTTCNSGICTKTLYSGVRNVYEDETWKRVEDAKSLMGKGFNIVILEDDKDYPIEVVDFNYTSIRVKLNPKGVKIFNEDIPVRVWNSNDTKREEFRQDVEDGKEVSNGLDDYKEEMDKVYEYEIGFNLLNQEEEILLGFGMGKVLEFGKESTTITLSTPGSIVNNATVGVNAWTNPTFATANDGTRASASCSGEGCHVYSNFLYAKDWGASIPSGSTIHGILVNINSSQYCTYGCYAQVNLSLSNNKFGSYQINNVTGASYQNRSFGNLTFLWEETWTAEDINDEDFGIAFQSDTGAGSGSSASVYVEHLTITINYTEDSTPPNITINQPQNITYNSPVINFNITVVDDVLTDNCTYSIDGWTTNITLGNLTVATENWNATNDTMLRGSYRANFACNDSNNNINNTEFVDFRVAWGGILQQDLRLEENSGTNIYGLNTTDEFTTFASVLSGGTWVNDAVDVALTENTDYTLVGDIFTIINFNRSWSEINVGYTRIETTNDADGITSNFTKGIQNVSEKFPTILLIGIVVVLFSVITLVIRQIKLSNVEANL